MSRPKHPDSCIGRYPESNERMREAWKQCPTHGQTVWILRGGKLAEEEWSFSWFTLAGARLYKSSDTGYYATLINWDKGDRLFTNIKDLYLALALHVISEKTKHELAAKELDEKLSTLLAAIK